MATTISLNYASTFSVFDYVTQDHIGEVSLVSDGWAAYRVGATGIVVTPRLGTYPEAQDAIAAVNKLPR